MCIYTYERVVNSTINCTNMFIFLYTISIFRQTQGTQHRSPSMAAVMEHGITYVAARHRGHQQKTVHRRVGPIFKKQLVHFVTYSQTIITKL